MSLREFWNLAGRAGRIDHDSVGVVGLAAGTNPSDIKDFVSRATGDLASRLVKMLDELEKLGKLNELGSYFQYEQWEDFRCYVAHLWNEKRNLDEVLSNTEQLLRNTYGYGILESRPEEKQKAIKLIDATKEYIRKLSEKPEIAKFADLTGFSPEGIGRALSGVNSLENKLSAKDWSPKSLFGEQSSMADMYGVMLQIPQLRGNLEEITARGLEHQQIAGITKAWVNGASISDIAKQFFKGEGSSTKALTNTCKAIYKTLVNNGTQGLSALSRLSGFDFDNLSPTEKRQINIIPAMVYHGVNTEAGVLLRMNSVPRSIAEPLGRELAKITENKKLSVKETRSLLRESDSKLWEASKPESSGLNGKQYKQIWNILAGESS